MKIAWASDTHFDFVQPSDLQFFFNQVRESNADMLILCGDISGGSTLESWLSRLELELNIPIRFVLGNHDFYKSSIAKTYQITRMAVNETIELYNGKRILSWLSDDVLEVLSKDTVLIGHDGWYDARAGIVGRIILNDFDHIEDLRPFFFAGTLIPEIQRIADISAEYIDIILPKALEERPKVILATHVPPFPRAAWHEGHQSGIEYLPYFCSVCMGDVLVKHMKANPDKELLVLCGHTHGEGEVQILPNLKILTAGAVYGCPKLQGIIEI